MALRCRNMQQVVILSCVLLFVNVIDRSEGQVLWSLSYYISCCPTNASEPSVTQEGIETVAAERVRTAVTISADTGHPCRVQIINLTMKTEPSECPGDSRHCMEQRGQEGCRCHAATLASGWQWRADMSCCAGWEVDRLGYKVAGAYCNIEPAK